MHFGKALLAQRHEPWANFYLDYSGLKNLLEQEHGRGTDHLDEEVMSLNSHASSSRLSYMTTTRAFVELFDRQVEQVVYFFLEQQGLIAQKLYQLWAQLKFHPEDDETLLTQQLETISLDLLHLIQFVDLNVTAIRKILKKHDRVVKGRRKLSQVYLGTGANKKPPVVLKPLFEHGGLDALTKAVQDAFHHLHIHEDELTDWTGYGSTHESNNCINTDEAGENRQETVLKSIQDARQSLNQTRDFVYMLTAQMLMETEHKVVAKEEKYEKRRISNLLNFMSTFLHLTDYYIVAPGCGAYAEKMGGDASLAGVIIGMNSVAALISTVLYSWWTSRSYKAPLLCATTCQILGDIIYALALPLGGSLKLVMLGRLVSGFGSARALNRRYIADTFPPRERTAASAAFVTAGALGTSVGPAFAAALYLVVPETSTSPYWQAENAPCWVMSVVWFIYLATLLYFFDDPRRPNIQKRKSRSKIELTGLTQEGTALLKHQLNNSALADSVRPLWENIPVMTTFIIYFVLKFILESLLSSTATLTSFYFGWEGSRSGTYLAIQGLLVLPANWLVALVAQSYDDRELIIAIEICMLLGCVAILEYSAIYSVSQYIFGSIVIFVSTNALEGPTMSLLSKAIPPFYGRGFLNVGLLATEAGTLGRAVGDVILTFCGTSGLEYILNNAFGAMSALSLITLLVTRFFYEYLEPLETDD